MVFFDVLVQSAGCRRFAKHANFAIIDFVKSKAADVLVSHEALTVVIIYGRKIDGHGNIPRKCYGGVGHQDIDIAQFQGREAQVRR